MLKKLVDNVNTGKSSPTPSNYIRIYMGLMQQAEIALREELELLVTQCLQDKAKEYLAKAVRLLKEMTLLEKKQESDRIKVLLIRSRYRIEVMDSINQALLPSVRSSFQALAHCH